MKVKCSRDGVADVNAILDRAGGSATGGRVGTLQISLLESVRVFFEQLRMSESAWHCVSDVLL